MFAVMWPGTAFTITVCAMSEPGNEGEPSSVLMLRHMAIDACQDGQLVAIVFNYDEEQPEA